MSPFITRSPWGFFTLRLFTLSLQQFFGYGSGFLSKCRLPRWFHPEKPQLPLFTCGPPQSWGWQFASSDRCKRKSPFPFLNLHSPKLSYPVPRAVFHFFTFLVFLYFLFASRFIEDWLLGFHVLAVSHLSSFLDYPIKIRACQPSPATLTSCSSSVQFSHSVVSDSLWPHESQHTRPPYPSPTSGVYPNSCPLSRWCHSTISSSVVPFSPCPQSFPASGSFPMSQHFRYYLVHSLTCLLSISY